VLGFIYKKKKTRGVDAVKNLESPAAQFNQNLYFLKK
jgi:hypothetical protein